MNQSSLDFKLVQRVCLLQQALDQALDSLEEMRGQVQDKQWIEAQLANTEKYANVQQQAIAQLKQHLAQFTEVQQHLLGVMAYRLNGLIDDQQVEFKRLQIQIQKSETELQTYLQYLRRHCNSGRVPQASSETCCLDLEAEVMIARAMTVSLSSQLKSAQQHLGNLTSALNNHHLNLSQIIKTVQAMSTDLTSLDAIVEDQPQSEYLIEPEILDQLPEDSSFLQDALQRQERRIHELETVLKEQFEQQTQLKQRCQGLAAERDYYKRQFEQMKKENLSAPVLPADEDADIKAIPLTNEFSSLPRLRLQPPPPIQPLRLQEELE
ncbi:MAG: hypothetical protein F6K42_08620 [Leptolyngbya sp. SIO1D8]|nr:hypothetical protein [Leptolyngbya sp. SIO1D8]